MKKLSSCFLACAFAVMIAPRAQAVFTFTVSQVGTTVQTSGSGTLNLSALSASGNASSIAELEASSAVLIGGPSTNANFTEYVGNSLTGPNNFGPGFNGGTEQPASSGMGDHVGAGLNTDFGTFFFLVVPQGYVSGNNLSNTDTFSGTYASLGITPGTYTFNWGTTAANDDSLVINIVPLPVPVPEPSAWSLLGLGTVGAGIAASRRRRAGA